MNIIRSKPAPLKCKLVVVVPMFGGSPQPCPDALSLLSAGSFSIETHVLVVETHVIEVDISSRQDAKRADRIDTPEARCVIRWIVEFARIIQGWSEGKCVDGPVATQ